MFDNTAYTTMKDNLIWFERNHPRLAVRASQGDVLARTVQETKACLLMRGSEKDVARFNAACAQFKEERFHA